MAKIGFVLSHEQFAVPDLLEYGVAAEQAGFDMVWTSDHFLPWQDNQNHVGQAWVTLSALGQKMPRIPFGTGVTCPSYRYNPAVVAQAFATLGLIYPGRVFLGIGTGEALNEQAATGTWGDYEERAERFIEAIEIIRKMWSGEWFRYQGKHFQIDNAKIYDLPSQPVPLYIAAEGEKSMRLAGKYGDGLISDAKTASMPDMRAAFEQGAREAGKDPSSLTVHAEHFVVVGNKKDAEGPARLWNFLPNAWSEYVNNPDPRDIERQAASDVPLEKVMENWVISDDPDQHAHELQKLIDSGVTHIYVHIGQADQLAGIQFFGNEVLPRLRGERSHSIGH